MSFVSMLLRDIKTVTGFPGECDHGTGICYCTMASRVPDGSTPSRMTGGRLMMFINITWSWLRRWSGSCACKLGNDTFRRGPGPRRKGELPRRPAEIPTPQQMHVQVRHRLPGPFTAIDDKPIALVQAQLFR